MLNGLFQIVRPLNCMITLIVIIVGGMVSSPQKFISVDLFLAGVVGFLSAAAGNIVNDIHDIEIDRINRPERPLPSLLITVQQAWVFYSILILVSFFTSYFISPIAFLIVLLSNMLLFLYSYSLKKVPLFGNIVVSFLTAYAFIFGGVVVGNVRSAFVPAIFAFLVNLIREIVKDMEDFEGDKLAGAKTLPIKYGKKFATYFIFAVSLLLILCTLVPFIYQFYRIEYFLIVMIIVNPILVYIVKSLISNSSAQNLRRMSSLLKLDMLFGLIAIFFGK